MSVRDRQRLGELDSASVTVKCLVSHVHGEVCRLGYRLVDRHVEISVKALFSSRSVFNACVERNLNNFIVYLTIYANL